MSLALGCMLHYNCFLNSWHLFLELPQAVGLEVNKGCMGIPFNHSNTHQFELFLESHLIIPVSAKVGIFSPFTSVGVVLTSGLITSCLHLILNCVAIYGICGYSKQFLIGQWLTS